MTGAGHGNARHRGKMKRAGVLIEAYDLFDHSKCDNRGCRSRVAALLNRHLQMAATDANGGAEAGGVGAEGQDATKRPLARSTAATLTDLQVLWGGRDRLLRVGEVAELLAVGVWAVYRFCETGELAHVRINNSIRVRPRDLEEFIAARLSGPVRPSSE